MFISHEHGADSPDQSQDRRSLQRNTGGMRKNPGFMRDPWHPYTKVLLDSVMPPDLVEGKKTKSTCSA